MPSYKRLLSGQPWIWQPPFTEGFEKGVGYTKNFFKHNPMFVAYMGISVISFVGIIYKHWARYQKDPDEVYKYKQRYTVI